MTQRDYYEILGLSFNCSPQDIRKNYHKLALKWHPDKHEHKEEATSRFSEIYEAYTALINPQERQIYDKYGHNGLQKSRNGFDGMNIYFPGFQDASRSTFEIFLDLLFDRDEDFVSRSENTTTFSDDANLYSGNFSEEQSVDESNYFSNYTPNFNNPDFKFNRSLFEQYNISSISSDNHASTLQFNKKNVKQNNQTMKMTTTFSEFQPTQIINEDNALNSSDDRNFDIDSDDSNTDFMLQLNEFQSFLDEFHLEIEKGLNIGTINSTSKKITKRPRLDIKNEHQRRTGTPHVSIYS